MEVLLIVRKKARWRVTRFAGLHAMDGLRSARQEFAAMHSGLPNGDEDRAQVGKSLTAAILILSHKFVSFLAAKYLSSNSSAQQTRLKDLSISSC